MGGLRKVCKLLISRLARILANDMLSPLIQHYRPAVPRQTAAGEQKATRYQTEASVRE